MVGPVQSGSFRRDRHNCTLFPERQLSDLCDGIPAGKPRETEQTCIIYMHKREEYDHKKRTQRGSGEMAHEKQDRLRCFCESDSSLGISSILILFKPFEIGASPLEDVRQVGDVVFYVG